MGTVQKIITTSLWAITVLMMVFIVTAGIQIKRQARESANGFTVANVEPAQPPTQDLFDAPQFQLVDQQNRPVSNATLHGKVWVSQFIFTTCTSLCPMMMQKMAQLQKTLDPRIELVSFSVDPDHDRPGVLLAKANELGADDNRWLFLTNPDNDKMQIDHVLRGFFQPRPGPLDPPTMHSEKFFLFDGDDHCRGIYSSSNPEQMQQLSQDAATVLAGSGLAEKR